MQRRKLFATVGIRVICEATSQSQTDPLVVKGRDLVQSLVEAAS